MGSIHNRLLSKKNIMRKTILFAMIAATLLSCKKEKEEPAPVLPVVYPNFSNLAVGNYWIYERFTLDTNGVYTTQNIFDSSYVDKDTVVNGNTFYKFNYIYYPYSNSYVGVYLRDSLSFMVNSFGDIRFSSEIFTDTFYTHYFKNSLIGDTISFIFSKMNDNNLSVSLPAGNYITKNYQTTYLMFPAHSQGGPVRTINNRYAENVGLVEETLIFFLSDPNYTVRRLKRYGRN